MKEHSWSFIKIFLGAWFIEYLIVFVMFRDLLGHRCDEYLPILHTSEIINEFFTCVRNWYKFFTCVRNWYQFFTSEKKSHQFFTGVMKTYQFFTCQKLSTWEIWAQILDPKIYRNWPYVNFTFRKCDVLVPILLMGVKFTKWEIYGSTGLWPSKRLTGGTCHIIG